MEDYYTVVTNVDKYCSIVDGYLSIGYGCAKRNKKSTKKEAIQFLKDVEAAKAKCIESAEEYIGRRKHYIESIKTLFRKELKELNAHSFRIIYSSFKDIKV